LNPTLFCPLLFLYLYFVKLGPRKASSYDLRSNKNKAQPKEEPECSQETSEACIQNLDNTSTSTSSDALITSPSSSKNLVPLLTNTQPSIQTPPVVQTSSSSQPQQGPQPQAGANLQQRRMANPPLAPPSWLRSSPISVPGAQNEIPKDYQKHFQKYNPDNLTSAEDHIQSYIDTLTRLYIEHGMWHAECFRPLWKAVHEIGISG